ncbi:MAG: papain-like cysteine protease family protein [Pyrinomonadaceae bacterium]
MANIDYTVPGLIVPVQQPSGMSCWAAMFTMMYSWKNQQSIDIRTAVSQLGQKYLDYFDNNTGLPQDEHRNFGQAAGMQVEPLQNLSPEGWVSFLRAYGLLWTCYGWQVFDVTGLIETRAGRHIIVIYGLFGDGTADGTKVKYVDPSDGNFHIMPFAQFMSQHETGFTLRPLSNTQLGQFAQILHY